jgi:hypothetical protein
VGFLSWLTGSVTPNDNPGPSSVGPGHNPGDPDGVQVVGDAVESRAFSAVVPSPWDGWPAGWDVPSWGATGQQFGRLVDTAWACLDLNSSVLSTMPVYRTRGGQVIEPASWMTNPDPDIYTSWHEFAKQLFWDFQLGEAFVLPMALDAAGFPSRFRVIPPWLMNVDMAGSRRVYNLGSMDVTGDVLHIRYKSTTEDAHGHGPLEAAGARMTAAAVLSRYMSELVQQGGIPNFYLQNDYPLTKTEADDLLEQWVASRKRNVGKPAVLSGPVTAHQLQMSPKDMAMVELAQFNESRIAIHCGVPPFLVGLPSGGDSMCVDTETEILTRRGWKPHDDLLIGEDVLTLNHVTGMTEWQPLQDVNTFAVRDRAMVSIEMQGHSSFSTDDHKWPVVFSSDKTGEQRRIMRMSRDLKRTDALVLSAPCADLPAESKYSDAFVELVAWFYTEGTVGDYDCISIGQSIKANPAHVDRIRAAVRTVFGEAGWSEYRYADMAIWRLRRHLSAEVLAVMEDAKRKVIDRSFIYSLTQAQLELFVRVSVWADGCESSVQTTFKQKDTDRLERFELACTLAGMATMRHSVMANCTEVTVRRRGALRPVQADRRARRFGRELVRRATFTGQVWCPTTPNGTWFARRRGTTYFTHNTYSNVSSLFDFHDRASIRPKATYVTAAMSGWALPRGQQVELNRDEYTRPALNERAQAYAQLHAVGALSGEDIRRMERFTGEVAVDALTGGDLS